MASPGFPNQAHMSSPKRCSGRGFRTGSPNVASEGSHPAANDNPAISSQRKSHGSPADSSQPGADDPSKQPLERSCMSGLGKQGRGPAKAPPKDLQGVSRRLQTRPERPPKKDPEKGPPKLDRKRGCPSRCTRRWKAFKRCKFQGFLNPGTPAGPLGFGVYRHPFWGPF